MFNPMTFGVSPQQMAAAREVGNYVEVRFTRRRSERKFTVELLPKRPEAELAHAGIDLGQMADQMVEVMAGQLYNFFGIGGKIQDVA